MPPRSGKDKGKKGRSHSKNKSPKAASGGGGGGGGGAGASAGAGAGGDEGSATVTVVAGAGGPPTTALLVVHSTPPATMATPTTPPPPPAAAATAAGPSAEDRAEGAPAAFSKTTTDLARAAAAERMEAMRAEGLPSPRAPAPTPAPPPSPPPTSAAAYAGAIAASGGTGTTFRMPAATAAVLGVGASSGGGGGGAVAAGAEPRLPSVSYGAPGGGGGAVGGGGAGAPGAGAGAPGASAPAPRAAPPTGPPPSAPGAGAGHAGGAGGAEERKDWAVGMVCDAQDLERKWFQGEILKIKLGADGHRQFFIHFEGFAPKWNEWVGSARLAPVGSRSEHSSTRFMSMDKGGPVVKCYRDQYTKLLGFVQENPHRETGGDLFGRWRGSEPEIVFVLGPGPRAVGGAVSFYQDEDYLEANGNILASMGLEHIGEWHSHHSLNLPTPSGGDCRTVTSAMRDYNREHFVLCIATVTWKGVLGRTAEAHVEPYVFTRGAARYRWSGWGSLGDRSPNAEYKAIDRPTRAVATHGTQWYSTAEGKAALAGMMSEAKAEFGVPKIVRHPTTHDLEFVFGPTTISFPSDFPASQAQLRASAGAPSSGVAVRYKIPAVAGARFEAREFIAAATAATTELPPPAATVA